ncbi:MAG: ABC transporter permease [Candidatus Thorarchaeota archaeon]|jgi:ABC-2 type transport system permease protein
MTTETAKTLEEMDTDSQIPGFINVMRKELFGERRKRFWFVQIFFWLFFVPSIAAIILYIPAEAWDATIGPSAGMTQVEASILVFFAMDGLMAALFVPILMMGEVVDELESGTAAWILSKPVSRTAFIMAKFIANVVSFLIVIVGIPGLVGYLMYAPTGRMTIIGYMTGLGLSALIVIYFMFLSIMVGVVTKSRNMVMGVAVGIVFGMMGLAQMFPFLGVIFPVMLPMFVTPFLAAGEPPFYLVPAEFVSPMIYLPIIQIVLFVLIAIWSFKKIEL